MIIFFFVTVKKFGKREQKEKLEKIKWHKRISKLIDNKNNNKNSNNDNNNKNNSNNSNNNHGSNNNNNDNDNNDNDYNNDKNYNESGIYNHNVIRIISSKSFSHHNTRNIDVTIYRLSFIECQWQVFEGLTFPPLSYYSPKFQNINVADNRIRY